jgi:hypothetical protein
MFIAVGLKPEIDHFVMTITSAEAIVRYPRIIRWLRYPCCGLPVRRTQMRNITLFAVAVALIATGFSAWAAWNGLTPSIHAPSIHAPSIHAPSLLEQMLTGKVSNV